ncbi:LADA_0B02388g1_1 [Lachancea dasiensis]|uniref:LADA_0B02388g1_1 n=1 Tax=Lachancea dasiensis TaxID=1072105 RepID=A0A1G4IS72_9SACH|nr:LADA_0B02388g1_1 [Lachancea dasiensis]
MTTVTDVQNDIQAKHRADHLSGGNIAFPHPFSTPESTPVECGNAPKVLSPSPEPRDNLPSKQTVLVSQVATLLSALTSKYSNHRVNNSKPHLVTYLTAVFKRSKCSKKIILLSIYYFHKLYTYKLDSITNLPEFSRCSKRVYLCCLILAHKFLTDQTFSMASWQRISGLSPKDISVMERWSLKKLEYELFISDTHLNAWCKSTLYSAVVEESNICKKRYRDLEFDLEMEPSKRLHTTVVVN